MSSLFLEWVAENLVEKHVVFDEDTCTHIEVGETFAVAILEDLFLGRTLAAPGERYRGFSTREIFKARDPEFRKPHRHKSEERIKKPYNDPSFKKTTHTEVAKGAGSLTTPRSESGRRWRMALTA